MSYNLDRWAEFLYGQSELEDGIIVLTYRTYFSASHRIPGHPKCGRVHGHNFEVKVWVQEDYFGKGMFDFGDLKMVVEDVLEDYDHYDIYERHGITSAEELAVRLFNEIGSRLKAIRDDLTLLKIKVCETEKYCVMYMLHGMGQAGKDWMRGYNFVNTSRMVNYNKEFDWFVGDEVKNVNMSDGEVRGKGKSSGKDLGHSGSTGRGFDIKANTTLRGETDG